MLFNQPNGLCSKSLTSVAPGGPQDIRCMCRVAYVLPQAEQPCALPPCFGSLYSLQYISTYYRQHLVPCNVSPPAESRAPPDREQRCFYIFSEPVADTDVPAVPAVTLKLDYARIQILRYSFHKIRFHKCEIRFYDFTLTFTAIVHLMPSFCTSGVYCMARP
jgi:hypothetical protein